MIFLMTGDDTTPPISLGQYSEEGLRPHCHSILIEELDTLILQIESLSKILIGLRSAREGKPEEISCFLTLRLGEVYVSPRKGK